MRSQRKFANPFLSPSCLLFGFICSKIEIRTTFIVQKVMKARRENAAASHSAAITAFSPQGI